MWKKRTGEIANALRVDDVNDGDSGVFFFHFYSFAFLYHDLATRHSSLALIVCLSVRHS